jgi:hypothetical protein
LHDLLEAGEADLAGAAGEAKGRKALRTFDRQLQKVGGSHDAPPGKEVTIS